MIHRLVGSYLNIVEYKVTIPSEPALKSKVVI